MITDARKQPDPSGSEHQDEARDIWQCLERLQCLESEHCG